MKTKNINFEEITIRQQISHRGGGIEIDLSPIAKAYDGQKMTAYQNYLGGGMLGAIANDCTIKEWRNNQRLLEIADGLARYFHDLTNHDEDEYESATFEQNQNRPLSAY
jgi:hypothetical protein